MSNNTVSLNAQLVYGVRVSDEFSAIIEEYDLFSFNHQEDIFFKVADYTIVGVTPPHEEECNTYHHILFAYEDDMENKSLLPFKDTLNELKTEFDSFYKKEILSDIDYDCLIGELKNLQQEKPHMFLFSED